MKISAEEERKYIAYLGRPGIRGDIINAQRVRGFDVDIELCGIVAFCAGYVLRPKNFVDHLEDWYVATLARQEYSLPKR